MDLLVGEGGWGDDFLGVGVASHKSKFGRRW